MDGREDQMSGFRRGQHGGNGLNVAHFPDHDHIGVLTERKFERRGETQRVRMQFPLFHHRTFVAMDIFDRIFDRNDFGISPAVDLVDQTGQGGGFAAAGRTGHHDQALMFFDQTEHRQGQ